MTSYIIRKASSELEKLKIGRNVRELELEDLTTPRVIMVSGNDKNGDRCEWLLKITQKNKLALL